MKYMNDDLNTLCQELGFQTDSLFSPTEMPNSSISADDWLEKGEWLAAAKRAGAKKVFFVENNPVAVFAECDSDEITKAKTFNRLWSLARPRLLFLVVSGEISVIDLAQKPVNIADMQKKDAKKQNQLKTLAVLDTISKVSQKLQDFHCDNVETGKIFGDSRFGDLKNRADKALIRDLKTIRRELIQEGLSGKNVKFAHALIGRSIFIRYLEDREILTKDYFHKVARSNSEWIECLESPPDRQGFDASQAQRLYPLVLEKKDFAYALFKSLAHDFNGDMFPDVEDEEKIVTQAHLKLLQDLLYGDVGVQKQLFFFSYRFDIVPLDIISSIYEEFYHSSTADDEKKSKAKQDGAFYTPSVLAEFVLSRILTVKELKKKPRVLDPACGSGSFLVEAFRRIVRYEWHRSKKRLSFDGLKEILRDQIAGIEINEEAARITAFSLYLALLHYLDPPAITEQIKLGNKLPNLLLSESKSKNHFHCIWVGNAFDEGAIQSNPLVASRFGKGTVDVIIGNPPWGSPGNKVDSDTRTREAVMLEWCRVNNRPIGNKELSQAFLWRSLDFLKKSGKVGMLVSAGVLFKHSTTSQAFRENWLSNVRLDEVFNFTHVRDFFFKGAISPFLAVFFLKGKQNNSPVKYWSAKQVISLPKTQAVLFSKYDIHVLRGENLVSNELWKSYWFGRPGDVSFLKIMQKKERLISFVARKHCGGGYKIASESFQADKLAGFRALDIQSFSRYDELIFSSPPNRVYRFGVDGVYSGKRLLIQRGISEKHKTKGIITARYTEDEFCFTDAIYGVKLKSELEWGYKILLGLLWSSLARYYFFLTSSNWGLWHHEIHLDDELFQLPVVFDKEKSATKKILSIVDKLINYHPEKNDIANPDGVFDAVIFDQRRLWENELDDAVYELYGLTDEQKDLIRDFCEITIPFFYKPFDSPGALPAVTNRDLSWIEPYVQVFSRRWNAYLEADVEMRAEIHIGAHENMVAVEFFPADKTDSWSLSPKSNSWKEVLEKIESSLPQAIGVSQILLDGVVHVVSDDSILVIKRNERRFWTRSLAREDADSTLCKRMMKSNAGNWEVD